MKKPRPSRRKPRAHSTDRRMDLTLKDMQIEPAASRDPFKPIPPSEDQIAQRRKSSDGS